MALTDTITVDDASGDDVVYALVQRDGTGTRRIDVATTLALPGFLNIRHSVQGSGSNAVDRHLVQIIRTVSATPDPVQLICNFTLQVPRNAAVTNQIVFDAVANLLDLIMSGGLTTLTTTDFASLLLGSS